MPTWYFLLSADFFFQNQLFRKVIFQEYHQSIKNSMDPDQVRRFVGPDLGPNCLQNLSENDASRQIVNYYGTGCNSLANFVF